MEVRIYNYLCVEKDGKKYLKQVTVDNNAKTTHRVATLLTFAASIFTRHKAPYIEIEDLLPEIEIEPASYQYAIAGQVYNEFQVEIRQPTVSVGPGTTEIKSETLPAKRMALVKPAVVITQKMMLKGIIAEFYSSNEPFDKVADDVLSKFHIIVKK